MRTLNLAQGTEAWHAHRATSRNASEAPVVMGASSKMARAELVRLRATGGEKEHSQFVADVLFKRGHDVEPLLCAYVERLSGLEFFPGVGSSDDGFLSASFDGVTINETVLLEAKQTNQSKMESVRKGLLPPEDRWQVVQQFAVCETAAACYYVIGDGSDEGTVHLVVRRADVEADIAVLRAAWTQFDMDVAGYQAGPATVEVIGRAPDELPTLFVQLAGGVRESNLAEFKEAALAVFAGINRTLVTDQDFANAEKAVGFCGNVEAKLKQTKEAALAQTASIDELFRSIDAISTEARTVRLELEKLVTRRKDEIRGEIVTKAKLQVSEFIGTLNESLSVPVSVPASLATDLAAAIKGKRSVFSAQAAADQVVANHKIAATTTAERYRANLKVLEESGRPELFADRQVLVATKATEDLQNLVKSRITAADALEAQRLEKERERIRKEEEQRAQQQAEQERLRKEREDKAQREAEELRQRLEAEAKTFKPADALPASNDPQPKAPETPAAVAVSDEATQPPVAADRPGVTGGVGALLKLGDINTRIAPLTISADGLAALGFQPHSVERASKLYREDVFPDICRAMGRVLKTAIESSSTTDQRRAA